MSTSHHLGRVNRQNVYLLLHLPLLSCEGEGGRQQIVDGGIVQGCVLEAAVNKHPFATICICSSDRGNKGGGRLFALSLCNGLSST